MVLFVQVAPELMSWGSANATRDVTEHSQKELPCVSPGARLRHVCWCTDAPSPFAPQLTALPLISAALLLALIAFVNVFRTALVRPVPCSEAVDGRSTAILCPFKVALPCKLGRGDGLSARCELLEVPCPKNLGAG